MLAMDRDTRTVGDPAVPDTRSRDMRTRYSDTSAPRAWLCLSEASTAAMDAAEWAARSGYPKHTKPCCDTAAASSRVQVAQADDDVFAAARSSSRFSPTCSQNIAAS
jgi:hypothetical protein